MAEQTAEFLFLCRALLMCGGCHKSHHQIFCDTYTSPIGQEPCPAASFQCFLVLRKATPQKVKEL